MLYLNWCFTSCRFLALSLKGSESWYLWYRSMPLMEEVEHERHIISHFLTMVMLRLDPDQVSTSFVFVKHAG